MSRRSTRRGSLTLATRARHLLAAGVGATLLVGLLGIGAAGAASAATSTDPAAHSAIVVQHDATVTIGASNRVRSHRLVVTGAFLSVAGLAAIAARCVAARTRLAPRCRGGNLYARLRAPPALLVVAH